MAYRYLLDQCSPDKKRLNPKQQRELDKRLAETFTQTNPHKSILVDSKTKQTIIFPHANIKAGIHPNSIFKGTGFEGKTSAQIRKMAKKSSQALVKALNSSEAKWQMEQR